MKKVALIQPKCLFNAYSYAGLPLIGPIYLGTILKQAGWQVRVAAEYAGDVYSEKNNELAPWIGEMDAIGISTLTPTASRAYQIADTIKTRYPQKKIIIGGPHATFMLEEALQHADAVVAGEAENVILSTIENDNGKTAVHGTLVANLDDLPFPDFSILDHPIPTKKYSPIISSRGCPYNCTFCSVTAMFGGKYRFRSPDNVLEELKQRIKLGYRKFFFYDDNFTASLSRTKQFLTKCLKEKLKFRWVAETRVDVAKDEELLNLISKTNCRSLLIGFESINPETLKLLNKKQGLQDIRECIRKLRKFRIGIHGMFVLGADADEPATLRSTISFCKKNRIRTAQFGILIPLPGTKLFHDMEKGDRLLTRDWSLYDGTHVVFTPLKMTALELQKNVFRCYKKFYTFLRIRFFIFSRMLLMRWTRDNHAFMRYLRELSARTEKILRETKRTLKHNVGNS
ncbi:MAG: radical SAM protein [bacterium]